MGNTWGALSESWPPAPAFSTADIPDLTGKVIMITGGNAGIGKETARVLLQHNARVYLLCRSAEKAQAAAKELKSLTRKTDNDVRIIIMDLANLATISQAIETFLQRESRLDVLFASGGMMVPPIEQLTPHGHDMQFGTNVLGHFYLTQLLLPTLISSAKSSPDGHARVVVLSSSYHWMAPTPSEGGPVVYESLTEGPLRVKMGTRAMYCQSKAANIMFSHALARKYGREGIISISLHPGGIQTDLQRHTESAAARFVQRMMLYPVSYGALTPLYAGTTSEALQLNGKYLGPWARVRPCREDTLFIGKQEELWKWLEAEVRKFSP